MNYGRMLGQYERTSVDSASKGELVVLCYDKAIQFLGMARRYYEDGEYEKKGMALQKALDIINELQSSLDFENGGQIALNLDRIYSYLSQRLLLADYSMDLSIFDEAVKHLTGLKEAWEHVARQDAEREAEPVPPKRSSARESSRLAAA